MFVFFLQHRRLLYDLFTKNYKVRRNIVQARLNQEFGDVCKADVDRLLNVRWTIRLNISVFPSFSLNISDLTAPSVLFLGVLQQPRRDVVPQGNNTVLTLSALPPAVTVCQSDPLPGVQWEGSETEESQSRLAQL